MDIKHFYIEKGQGKPLILLHGNGDSSDYFRGQIDEFAREFHVIALDTRGHGRTPRGEMPFTIRQFADDLRGFLDVRGIDRANILGFSDGGNIAMIFAMRYPERVDRLILNGANLNTAGVKRIVQVPIELGYRIARKKADKSDSARKNAEMLGLMVNDPNVDPKELSAIRAKTLVIAGTRDLIKASQTRQIAAGIPDAELVWIKGDHFIARKNPGDYNRAVLAFLQE
jgi:pimeloyl-ACP methyl ester carboxylesterase